MKTAQTFTNKDRMATLTVRLRCFITQSHEYAFHPNTGEKKTIYKTSQHQLPSDPKTGPLDARCRACCGRCRSCCLMRAPALRATAGGARRSGSGAELAWPWPLIRPSPVSAAPPPAPPRSPRTRPPLQAQTTPQTTPEKLGWPRRRDFLKSVYTMNRYRATKPEDYYCWGGMIPVSSESLLRVSDLVHGCQDILMQRWNAVYDSITMAAHPVGNSHVVPYISCPETYNPESRGRGLA